MQMYIWDLFADIYVVLRFYLTDCLFPSVVLWQGAGRNLAKKLRDSKPLTAMFVVAILLIYVGILIPVR